MAAAMPSGGYQSPISRPPAPAISHAARNGNRPSGTPRLVRPSTSCGTRRSLADAETSRIRAGQVASTRIQKALRAHGLKNGHAHVLMVLADEGATSQQAMIQELEVDPSVLVATLNDLEQAGLAQRRRDPADRRRRIVEISPRGTQLVADVYASIASVEAELFASLDPNEIGTLHRLLDRIRTATGEQTCDENEGH